MARAPRNKSPRAGRKSISLKQGAGASLLLGALAAKLTFASSRKGADSPSVNPAQPVDLSATQPDQADEAGSQRVLDDAIALSDDSTLAPARANPGDLLAAAGRAPARDFVEAPEAGTEAGDAEASEPVDSPAAEDASAGTVSDDAPEVAEKEPMQLAQAPATEAAPNGGTAGTGGTAGEATAGTGVDSAAATAGGGVSGGALGASAGALAAAGGGGGGGGGASSGSSTLVKSLRIVDPPIKNAKVVYDANHNSRQDDGEAVGRTDDSGNAQISYTAVAGGQFLVFGGTDTITGKVFDANSVSMIMKDEPNETNGMLSPLSTLLAQTTSISEADLKTLLGISEGTDLSTYDFYAEIAKGGAAATTANNVLKLSTMIQTVSNATTKFVSQDATVTAEELDFVSEGIARALKVAMTIPKVNGELDIDAITNLVSKFSTAAAAQAKSGVTDLTATLDGLANAFGNGTLDTQLTTVLNSSNVGGGSTSDILSFQRSLANLAEATYKAFDDFDPNASTSKITSLTKLSDSLESLADDLTDGSGLSANSLKFANLFQNASTLDQMATNLSTNADALNADPDELLSLVANDSDVSGITEYGNTHVSGTHLDTTYKGLMDTGVDLVNPTNTTSLFVNMDPTGSLNSGNITTFIERASEHTLPAFADSLDVTLRITQGEFDAVVDILDGAIDGTYGGSQAGADLRSFGIDKIGFNGTGTLNANAKQLQALMDDNLALATNEVKGSINDSSLTATKIDALEDWAIDHGINRLEVHLTAAQTTALVQADAELNAASIVTADAPVQGSQVTTSFKDLADLGVDHLNTTGVAFISLGDSGDTLSDSDVQALIDAGADSSLPSFNHSMTLEVSNAQLADLVDMLDGTVGGGYDGTANGVDLTQFGINHIGLDAAHDSGPLNLSLDAARAVKDAGLAFAPGDSIDLEFEHDSGVLSANGLRDLLIWSNSNGVDQITVELGDSVADAMASLGAVPDEININMIAVGTSLSTSFNDMATLGVDRVRVGDTSGPLSIDLGVTVDNSNVNTELDSMLTHFDGKEDIFFRTTGPNPEIDLNLGTGVDVAAVNTTVLNELKLLGIDTITGSDADHDGQADQRPTT